MLQWFEANEIGLIDWLVQSLNKSEKEPLGNHQCQNSKRKTQKLEDTWNKIPNDLYLKLIHSMPNRLAKVIKN